MQQYRCSTAAVIMPQVLALYVPGTTAVTGTSYFMIPGTGSIYEPVRLFKGTSSNLPLITRAASVEAIGKVSRAKAVECVYTAFFSFFL